MDIAIYLGQIIYVKTNSDDILTVKIKSKYNNQNQGYRVKILEKNGQNMNVDTIIYNKEIKRLCSLPQEIQQGIALTISFIPTLKFEAIKNLPSYVEFGEILKKD